jgi:hypothetical protein
MTETVEKHISKPALEKLLKAADVADREVAELRSKWGSVVGKAVTADHLDKFAFPIVKRLWKMDPAKAAFHIRALTLYIDLLGLAAQTDLEDVVVAAEQADRQSNEVVSDVLKNGGQAALKKFKDSIDSEDDPKKVQRDLTKRIAEWPELTEELDRLAENRLRDLRKVVKMKRA